MLRNISFLALFVLTVAGAIAFRHFVWDTYFPPPPPGYCCVTLGQPCVLQRDLSACRDAGGAAFDPEQGSCDILCGSQP